MPVTDTKKRQKKAPAVTPLAAEAQSLVKSIIKKGHRVEEIAFMINASAKTVYRWKAGTHPPTAEHLASLREYAKKASDEGTTRGSPSKLASGKK